MNIIKRITKNRKEVLQGKNTCEYVIVHHTGGSQKLWQSMLRYFQKADYLSVHYIVGREGEVIQYVEDKDVAYHAGQSLWKGRANMNMHSIGIEVVSNGHDYTDKQREAVLELIKSLMATHGINKENVLRHADISGYRGKWDIGPNFYTPRWGSWEGFQSALDNSMSWPEEKAMGQTWVQKREISNGERPEDMITRGEMFVMLHRLWKKIKGLE